MCTRDHSKTLCPRVHIPMANPKARMEDYEYRQAKNALDTSVSKFIRGSLRAAIDDEVDDGYAELIDQVHELRGEKKELDGREKRIEERIEQLRDELASVRQEKERVEGEIKTVKKEIGEYDEDESNVVSDVSTEARKLLQKYAAGDYGQEVVLINDTLVINASERAGVSCEDIVLEMRSQAVDLIGNGNGRDVVDDAFRPVKSARGNIDKRRLQNLRDMLSKYLTV